MPDSNQNYIYAYDDEARQIIIINAETGRQVDESTNSVCSVLAYLNEQRAFGKLRKFTLWCAYRTNRHIKPMQRTFLELGEKAVQGNADLEELERRYAQSEREAIATDTIGLRQGSEKAPGFLITRECINPHAFEGAKNAALLHCMWTGLQQNAEALPNFMKEMESAALQDITERTKQKQIDYLLDLIGA